MSYKGQRVSALALSVSLFASIHATEAQTAAVDSTASDYQMKTIVTASRRSQPAQWVSDDYELVPANPAGMALAMNTSEMLATSRSLVIQDYGGGASKHINLRGAGSERTLLLVDGKKPGTAEGDLMDVLPETVDRIEIVEGGQSSLYGVNAMGGVINFITKRPVTPLLSGDVSCMFTSYAPKNLNREVNGRAIKWNTGKRFDRLDWQSSVNWNASDGRFEYKDSVGTYQVRENNAHDSWGIMQKVRYLHPKFSVGASGRYVDRDLQSPGMITSPVQATTLKRVGAGVVDGAWAFTEWWRSKANGAYTYERIHYQDPNPAWPQDSRHTRTAQDAEWIHEFDAAGQQANAGFQVRHNTVTSNEIGDHIATQTGVFTNAILTRTLDRLELQLTPAGRFDHSNVFGNTGYGKAGLRATTKVRFSPSLLVNIGNSSKAPEFDQLYWPEDMFAVGNPDLKPEKSLSWDAGVAASEVSGNVAVSGRLVYFQMNIDDMIMWQPRSDYKWTPQNLARAEIKGFKAKVQTNYNERMDIRSSYQFLRAVDKSSDTAETELIYRPKHIFSATAQYNRARFTAGTSVHYRGSVFTDAANTTALDGYSCVDMNVGCRLMSTDTKGKGMWLHYGILNLTDADRITNKGYPLPGREHRLSLSMRY